MTIPLSSLPPPTAGLSPLEMVRNGVVANAPAMRSVIALAHQMLAKRMKVVFRGNFFTANPSPSNNDYYTARFRYRASTLGAKLRCRYVLAPMQLGVSSGDATWTVWDATNSANIPQDTLRHIYFKSAHYGNLGDLRTLDQDFSGIVGGTTYECSLRLQNYIWPVSVVVYEVPVTSVDLASSIAGLAESHGIYGSDVQYLFYLLQLLYDNYGTNHFAWSNMIAPVAGVYPPRISSATATNPFDGASTAYGANAPGFWTWPQYHGTLDSNNIPLVCWCYARLSASTGHVKFVDSVGTIADITITAGGSGDNAFKATLVNWSASAATSRKVDILISAAAGDMDLYAAGMYEASAVT